MFSVIVILPREILLAIRISAYLRTELIHEGFQPRQTAEKLCVPLTVASGLFGKIMATRRQLSRGRKPTVQISLNTRRAGVSAIASGLATSTTVAAPGAHRLRGGTWHEIRRRLCHVRTVCIGSVKGARFFTGRSEGANEVAIEKLDDE
jgi:hypothetical protein